MVDNCHRPHLSTIIIEVEHLIDHIAEVKITDFTAATEDHILITNHIVIFDHIVTKDLKT